MKRAIHFLYEEECFICRSKDRLHVHHKTYDRIYNEILDDLVLVCSNCHNKIHEWQFTKEESYEMLLNWTYKSKQQKDFDIFSELFPKIKK